MLENEISFSSSDLDLLNNKYVNFEHQFHKGVSLLGDPLKPVCLFLKNSDGYVSAAMSKLSHCEYLLTPTKFIHRVRIGVHHDASVDSFTDLRTILTDGFKVSISDRMLKFATFADARKRHNVVVGYSGSSGWLGLRGGQESDLEQTFGDRYRVEISKVHVPWHGWVPSPRLLTSDLTCSIIGADVGYITPVVVLDRSCDVERRKNFYGRKFDKKKIIFE